MTEDAQLPRLTPAELDIMKVLWTSGRLSAREIHEQVASRHGWAYSTTRTTIERMVVKDLVAKNTFHRLHLYTAILSRPAGMARMVRDFAERVLESGTAPVVALFADSGALTRDEITELETLLAQSDEDES